MGSGRARVFECHCRRSQNWVRSIRRASANETGVTREDFSSPLGAFLTQIPKPDSKKFYKRVPPKLFSIYSCGVFLIYSCWLNDSRESAEWGYSWGLLA